MSESIDDVIADFKSYAEQLCMSADADDAHRLMMTHAYSGGSIFRTRVQNIIDSVALILDRAVKARK